MELIDILESNINMGYGEKYIKYREIIKTILEEFNNEEILEYKVE